MNTKECDCWVTQSDYPLLYKKLPDCLAKGLHPFASPPAGKESSRCPTPSSALGISALYFRCSSRGVVGSHCHTHRFKVREKPTIQYILPYLIKTHHKKVYNGENKCLKPSAQSPQLNTVDLLPHSQAEVSRGKVWTARTLYILLFHEALE